jgi:hypothetical protein
MGDPPANRRELLETMGTDGFSASHTTDSPASASRAEQTTQESASIVLPTDSSGLFEDGKTPETRFCG